MSACMPLPPMVDSVGRELLCFITIAFGWSWSVWAVGASFGYTQSRWLFAPIAWGTMIAGLVVVAASGRGVWAWIRQVIPRRSVGFQWYLAALCVPLFLTQSGHLVGWLLGHSVDVVDPIEFIGDFLFVLLLAGALEEFGWRGYLQQRLQGRWSALVVGLLIGLLWALWHVPIVAGGGLGYDGNEWLALFLVLPMFSIIMAWLYNSTRGGLIFVMGFHAMVNASPLATTADPTPVLELVELGILFGVPIAIVLF